MPIPIVPKKYVALVLMKAKSQIFNENFATTSELNEFRLFMQQEFNKRKIGVVITQTLFIGDFNVQDDVVTITDRCCFDLERLPDKILNILTDESLILEFFMKMETKRLEILKNFPKYSVADQLGKNKQLSRVLLK